MQIRTKPPNWAGLGAERVGILSDVLLIHPET